MKKHLSSIQRVKDLDYNCLPSLAGANTMAVKPTAAFDAKWGQFVIDPTSSPVWSMKACDAFAQLFNTRMRPSPLGDEIASAYKRSLT
jgi:hypothetical protein